jgi:hypothetical protein
MFRTALLATVTLASISSPASAFYFCSEPSPPSCATRYGDFDDQDEFETCLRRMKAYGREVEDFTQCLANASDAAIEQYNSDVRRFNARAGG